MQQGRMAFRALEEILEVDQSSDLPGTSLVITGEANPILDTRVELKGLREDLSKGGQREMQGQGPLASFIHFSSGDTIIRDQIKRFAKMLDFHKGLFFLTSDRSNAALAKAEGLHPVYYKMPNLYEAKRELTPPTVQCDPKSERIVLGVPFGKLLYELAVQYGSVKVVWDTTHVEVGCDGKGENLDFWLHKYLRIKKGKGLNNLLKNYELVGRFSLEHVKKASESFREKVVGAELA
jgi:hypothetical protein